MCSFNKYVRQENGYVLVETCRKECQHTHTSISTFCCITKASQLVPCREIITVSWTNHLKHINILCEQNADFLYYWLVCSKDFNLPFKSVHCLYECRQLLSSAYYYLFPLFLTALKPRFRELLPWSKVFVACDYPDKFQDSTSNRVTTPSFSVPSSLLVID